MSDHVTGDTGATVPGVLVSVHGCGLLLTGDSGTGKSDTALQLLGRGHRLVADDAVALCVEGGRVIGRAPAALAGLLEVRGLGPQSVTHLFGGHAVLAQAAVDRVIRLMPPPSWADWPRLTPTVDDTVLADRPVPRVTLPVSPERPLALLVEVVARLHAGGQLTGGTA
ncbi:HPr kinase/phosphorylase [Aquisalimonas asiatica]|uniref:HPr kinase/phosphorylase n=1 Tax=Aquisalimonas asiatica TaxID=406100 RepID=A0A1H8S9M3_9GAMM|nr:HPr kinase/phosphorylase [Aquisalimonas asiatica]SEO75257.1 HPr kinase/phosphorylase [Aquisalimonas asiatica]